ncbi:CBS domain-containing protein [Streptomyces antibioticus]|uniref:CBS domain-containing protein n=1 Tax=Streptomyces antibioticus TaxID=1890 RepID=UPI0022598F95|nr:CBS domain-containing protein [Streptomyces antibioticus]MCX4741173.1 CBS domain-containing protein [Streptomyces antibioticus]
MARIVGEVMTRDVVEAHRETSFKDVVRLLDRHRVSGLPVVDEDDKVVGVISQTDLIRRQAGRSGMPGPATASPARRLRMLPSGRSAGPVGSVRAAWTARSARALRSSARAAGRLATGARAATAGELMSSPAVTVHPEQRIADAARVMERHGVDRLPVVDEEDRLIGIATRSDLLRVFLRTDDAIRREVQGEVLPRTLGPSAPGVSVSVADGMVTLRGALEHGHGGDLALAIRLTYRVDGVIGVVNRLTVPAGSGPVPGP